MRRAYRWLNERADLAALKRSLLDREVPDRLTWWHTLGSATLSVFLAQLVTGLVLAMYYSPSPDHAYDSIQFLEEQVVSGALLRSIHHWGASAMMVLVVAHLLRIFMMGAYKYPREINWLVGLLLLLAVVGFGFTGYLLPWDQKAYWATQVGTNMAGTVPLLGPMLVKLLRGGTQLGAATLTRFYALHVLWLPLLLGALALVHLTLVIRQGIAPRTSALEPGAPRRTSQPEYAEYYRQAYASTKKGGVRFWPDIVGKDALAALGAVAAIVALAALFPAGLEAPADPTDSSYVPRPEWYFLPHYQLLKMVPGSLEGAAAVGVPILLLAGLLALPFFDRNSARHLLRRPGALAALALALGASAFLFGGAVQQVQTVSPPEVGRPLTPAERAGRALFKQQGCANCHSIGGVGGNVAPELIEIGLRHSPGWIHSFLEEPTRFHPGTTMPPFGPPVLTHQEIEELSLYLASLRGPPGSKQEPEYQDTFPLPGR
ncbi:MAG: cytochrome b N-terminal domain-containing protein [Gemmatimonadetes bacterium]|nr:cytochrome b N-terminal domain-containing protein [Gemmatimonadota bacterium]